MSDEKNLLSVTTVNFLDTIRSAALDPNVDVAKMHGLLDVQERLLNKQAEIDFNADFHALQSDLPRITKDAKILHKGVLVSTYAKYETIDSVIRPLLAKHNFSLRFNTETQGQVIVITGTLSHRGGHSVTDKIPLGIESSGAKNSVQGVGSTITYGKRYLVGMLLNLVFEGEDDDGNKAGHRKMTPEQVEEIESLLTSTGADRKRFLSFVNAESVEKMSATDFQKAVNALRKKGTSQ